tara:strand:+ start:21709 stop:22197 length:489 start_codon:yes stop_codon:yes gene_type:complete
MQSIKNYFVFALLISTLFGCEKKEESQPSLQANQIAALLASPEMLNLNNYLLKIESDIWRNFMPPIDSNGSALMAQVVLSERNQRTLNNSVQLEKVYLINQNELWSKTFDSSDSSSPYQISGMVRNGPIWGPNIKVDLVCEFSFGGQNYRLLARDQEIYATY